MMKRYLLLPVACALAAIGSARAQGALPCTNPITSFPYNENFDSGAGGWVSDGANSSWALGTPDKPVINSAFSGANSWTTNLTGSYTVNERSAVISPCFNLSSLALPIVEVKIWWDAEAGWDGTVLQSSIDGGATWVNVGAVGDPDNWYNDASLDGRPGDSNDGWSGRGTSSSGGWVTAKHVLTGLAGQANVRLRFAFGSDASGQYDGFAFDNFQIYQPSAIDVGVVAFTSPVNGTSCAASGQTVTVQVRNFGSAPQSNIPVSYAVNGGTPVTGTFAGPLAPGATAAFTFPTPFTPAGNGTYTFTATTNLAGDGNASNNAAPGNVVFTLITPIAAFPYNENFDGGAGGWTSGGTSSSWALGTPAKPIINSAFSGANSWTTNLTAPYNANESSFVLSPCFDFSSLALPTVEVKIWWNAEAGWDGTVLQSSIDGGATWVNVGAVGDPDNWYNDASLDGRPGGSNDGWSGRGTGTLPGSGGWVSAKHEMPNLANQSSVRLRFAFGSDGSGQDDGFAFDNFQIYQPSPNDVGVTAILAPATGTSCTLNAQTVTVQIRNFGSAPQSNIPVSYTVNGGTPVTGTFAGPLAPGASASFTFPTSFSAGAQGAYTFTATTNLAGDGNTTNDVVPSTVVFTIVTPITAIPYTQNFENGAGGWTSGGANSSWALGTPSKNTISGAVSGSQAWVTGLTALYNNDEQSYVLSPCFDLTGVALPGIEMNIWWDADVDDGAVLQSSIDGGATWQTIGNVGDPDNWYNRTNIISNPGGQDQGWTGNGAAFPTPIVNGSGMYVLAKHEAPQLANRPSVRFRVAFASDAFGNDDGFAFDDFKIVALTPPPPPPANDVAVLAIAQPSSGCTLTNSELITLVVANRGTDPQTNVPVTVVYTKPGGATVTLTRTIPGTLLPGAGNAQPVFFTQPQDLSARGCYNFTAYTSLATDTVRSNDTVRAEVCNLLIAVTPAAPYQQTFEGSNGWSPSAGGTWALGMPAKSAIQGAGSGVRAWVTGGLGTGRYGAFETSSVTSPCFDLSSLTAPMVELKVWYETEVNRDGASLQCSINNGGNWTTIGAVGDSINWYTSSTIDAQPGSNGRGWTGSSGGYLVARHTLIGTPAFGQPQVRFRMVFAATQAAPPAPGDSNDGIAFDDFAIYDRPTNDVAVVGLEQIGTACGLTNAEQIQMRVRNQGRTAVTSLPVSYQVQGGAVVTSTVTVALAPGEEAVVTFPQLANLTTAPCLNIVVTASLPGDQIAFNNSYTGQVCNSAANTIPSVVTFDGGMADLDRFRFMTRASSRVALAPGRGAGLTTALMMTGGTGSWIDPIAGVNPWTSNPAHLATATFCVKPNGLPAGTPLRMAFNLGQVSTGGGGLFANVNFRVLVNNTVVGQQNYQPDALNPGAGNFRWLSFDITSFRNGNNNILVQLESSVFRNYTNNQGDANFIDNFVVDAGLSSGAASAFAQGVAVFPNPSAGVFHVSLHHAGNHAYDLTVTDLTGRVVRQQAARGTDATEAEVDLTALSRGTYLLQITDSDGNRVVRKLTLE